ncbi:MAG: DUF423 domain-containing protein [Thiotrichaceae bacterium]|nr:DUF423 domain-containing protein [Thiotrichaceae bacterium]
MKFKSLLLMGSIFALLAVVLGAFGAHALKDILTTDQSHTYETAIKYQFYHSFALLSTGILFHLFPKNRSFQWAGYLFAIGMILFSGSLFLYLATDYKALVFLTPIGGLTLIIAWLVMIISIVKIKH